MTKIMQDEDVFKWSSFVDREASKGVSKGVMAALGAFYNAATEKEAAISKSDTSISYGFNYVYDAKGQKREERAFESETDKNAFYRNRSDRANLEKLTNKFEFYMNALSTMPHDSSWHKNSAQALKDAIEEFEKSTTRHSFNFGLKALSKAVDQLLADPKLFDEVQENISPAATRKQERRTPLWMETLADIRPAEVSLPKY